MNLTHELFDRIYCINLPHRKDRRKESEEEFAKHNIQGVQFWPAVDGRTYPQRNGLDKGNTGCILSHLAVIKDAKAHGYDRILIFEDDVEFADNYNEVMQGLPYCPVFYLGGSDKYASVEPLTEEISLLRGTLCTHAYALFDSVFDQFIEVLEKGGKPIDVLYSELSEKIDFYGFRPKIAWQRESYSDILNKKIRYKSCTNEPNPDNEW